MTSPYKIKRAVKSALKNPTQTLKSVGRGAKNFLNAMASSTTKKSMPTPIRRTLENRGVNVTKKIVNSPPKRMVRKI